MLGLRPGYGLHTGYSGYSCLQGAGYARATGLHVDPEAGYARATGYTRATRAPGGRAALGLRSGYGLHKAHTGYSCLQGAGYARATGLHLSLIHI